MEVLAATAEDHLKHKSKMWKKEWISEETLNLMARREEMQKQNKFEELKQLERDIKKRVKKEKLAYLESRMEKELEERD
eukprot:2647264-Karenia_brevis.AAC.1